MCPKTLGIMAENLVPQAQWSIYGTDGGIQREELPFSVATGPSTSMLLRGHLEEETGTAPPILLPFPEEVRIDGTMVQPSQVFFALCPNARVLETPQAPLWGRCRTEPRTGLKQGGLSAGPGSLPLVHFRTRVPYAGS